VELALSHGPVKLQGEYIRAEFEGKDFDRDMSAWYASLNWLVTGETFAGTYKDGVFGRLRPKQNFSFDGDGWGALQVGVRYSSFDGDDFLATNTAGTGRLAAGKTDDAHAWTLGANWILNPNVRMIANYVHTRFDTDVNTNVVGKDFDDEDAFTMRAQFDF
jgi:phosphate-selective porin OprO/OprP